VLSFFILLDKDLIEFNHCHNSTWNANAEAYSKSDVSVGGARSATSVIDSVPIAATRITVAISAIIVAVATLTLDFSSLLQFRKWRSRSWKPFQNYDSVSFFEVRYSIVLSIKSTETAKKLLSFLQQVTRYLLEFRSVERGSKLRWSALSEKNLAASSTDICWILGVGKATTSFRTEKAANIKHRRRISGA
jgi:hypothetical protein